MKRCTIVCVLSTIAMCLVVAGQAAAVQINIYAAGAPNIYGSSSYATWWSNAQSAIRAGSTSYGSGNAEYLQLSATGGVSEDQPGYQAVTTGFDSWHGVAGGTGELGTRIHFIYDIKANEGETISLANISGVDVLENGWGDTNYSIFTSFYGEPSSFDSTTTFDSNKRVGYTADGTLVTTGNDMTGVTEIIGNFGMSYAAYFPNGYYGGNTAQEALDNAIADMETNLQSWRGVLTYSGTTVGTTVAFVPEPGTMAALLSGGLLIGVVAAWRRRRLTRR
ncbi:MAG: PEP-CTERM sorting domain-containing protein [Thermoguttaceae bacterium]